MLVDSHCHLSFPELGSYSQKTADLIQEAKNKSVSIFLDVILKKDLLFEALSFSSKYNMIYNAFGVHPCDIEQEIVTLVSIEELQEIINSNNKIIAVGETGLDYFYSKNNKKLQIEAFEKHCEVASILKKPVIVHTRNAIEDTINVLNYYVKNKGLTGIIHCFASDQLVAKLFLDLDFLISFSGIVTFKNSKIIQEAVKFIPNNQILVETDSPYLAPIPYRGKVNQPAYTYYIAKFIATLKNMEFKEFSYVTTNNFKKLFNLV